MLVDAGRLAGAHLDPDSIDAGVKQLRKDATVVREEGVAVVNAWQGLSACYETPDTDQALRALDPVRAATEKLADDLEQIADVLARFAEDTRSLQAKRTGLAAQINDFRHRVMSGAGALGGVPLLGMLDPQQSFEHSTLQGKSVVLAGEFETAELECANRIKAIGHPATLLEQAGGWLENAWNQTLATGQATWDSVAEAGEDLGDAIGDAFDDVAEWTTARADDLSGWVGDRIDTITRSWTTFGEAIALLEQATEGTPDDPRPQLTAVGASYLQYLGAGIDALLTTATWGAYEIDFADDGEPWAGEPIKYNEDNVGQVEPTDLRTVDDLLRSVTASYETNVGLGQVTEHDYSEGYVRVTKVIPPDGPDGKPGEPMMVVSIPGTQPWFQWNDWGNDHPADWIGNLIRAGGGRTTYSDSVALAIDQVVETDPSLRDASVMLVGHSQGGMTAADLGSDAEFVREHRVTDVVTFGAPIANDRIHESVDVVEIAHDSDIVPKLDIDDLRLDPRIEWVDGPAVPLNPPTPTLTLTSESNSQPDPERHTSIALPDPQASSEAPLLEKPAMYHDHRLYSDSVMAALNSDQSLIEYQDKISGGEAGGTYLYENSTFEVYDVPVKRMDQ